MQIFPLSFLYISEQTAVRNRTRNHGGMLVFANRDGIIKINSYFSIAEKMIKYYSFEPIKKLYA
jgi:hypothetical protein